VTHRPLSASSGLAGCVLRWAIRSRRRWPPWRRPEQLHRHRIESPFGTSVMRVLLRSGRSAIGPQRADGSRALPISSGLLRSASSTVPLMLVAAARPRRPRKRTRCARICQQSRSFGRRWPGFSRPVGRARFAALAGSSTLIERGSHRFIIVRGIASPLPAHTVYSLMQFGRSSVHIPKERVRGEGGRVRPASRA